ncbi:recombinase family protein [Streptomyces sp. NPDC002787]
MKLATSSPERQREDVLTTAASVGGHIIGWADDWEVSGATDPMTRPKSGPWLRDESGPYDGLVAAAVDRLGRNVVDCLTHAPCASLQAVAELLRWAVHPRGGR